jgi:hypothetical protein
MKRGNITLGTYTLIMRFNITVLLVLLSTCKLNGQCNLKTKEDPFTGIKTISTDYVTIGIDGRNGSIQLKLTEYINKDTSLRLYFHVNRLTKRCLGTESKLMIKSGEIIVK